MKIKSFAFILILSTGLIASINGFAQVRISEGCNRLNEPDLDGQYFAPDPLIQLPFFANERIVVSAGAPEVDGVSTKIDLFVPFVVDTDGFPGTVSHLFLTDYPDETDNIVHWGTDGGLPTWTVECFPAGAPTPTPSASIPTLNWQGIAMLILVLVGFAYYRSRKIST